VAPTISVVAFDMDGTLLRSDDTVSPRTMAALTECRRRGMRLVVATGRRLASAQRSLPPELQAIPSVMLNGAHVYLDGVRIHHRPIPQDSARALARWIEERFPHCTLFADVDGQLYVNRPDDYPEACQVTRISEAITCPPCKMVVNLGDSLTVDRLVGHLPPGCRMIATAGGRWAEIVAPSVSKASGLEVLLRRWGLTTADTLTFGDDMNDLELVAEAGIGVAMGNAASELKERADLVAPSNDEDGMAQVLERLLQERCIYGAGRSAP